MAVTVAMATEGVEDRTIERQRQLICKCLDRSVSRHCARCCSILLIVASLTHLYLNNRPLSPLSALLLLLCIIIQLNLTEFIHLASPHHIIKTRLKDDDDHSSSNDARNAK